jgi:formylglycine-generating enzyme required for sulfatase activity
MNFLKRTIVGGLAALVLATGCSSPKGDSISQPFDVHTPAEVSDTYLPDAHLPEVGFADTEDDDYMTGDHETGIDTPEIDEEVNCQETVTLFPDGDGDGYGHYGSSGEEFPACDPVPDGWSKNNLDCDDSKYDVNPGVDEICDGIDGDCDGATDEDTAITVPCDVRNGNGNGTLGYICNSDGNLVIDGGCNDPDECDADTTMECDYNPSLLGFTCTLDENLNAYAWMPEGSEDLDNDGVCTAADLNGTDDDCSGVIDDWLCMLGVEEGEFKRGCDPFNPDFDCDPDNDLFSVIYLSGFDADKHETTKEQYAACVDAGVCTSPDDPALYDSQTSTHPVIGVTHTQAKDYCEYAGKRLLTEAEWEKAARGTDGRPYVWGWDDPTCSMDFYNIGCEGESVELLSVDFSEDDVSPFGVLGMSSNVMEWLDDIYHSQYYGNAPDINPQGPDSFPEGSDSYVIRGGSSVCGVDNKSCSSTYKRGDAPSNQTVPVLGLRCGKDQEE